MTTDEHKEVPLVINECGCDLEEWNDEVGKRGLVQQDNPNIVKALVAGLCMALLINGCSNHDWRTASRASAGIAPDPQLTSEAVIQVYGASAWGWRGWFAIHTWISMKAENATSYTVYEVIGWRLNRGLPVLRIAEDTPDRYWYGERPELLLDKRGEQAAKLIPEIVRAAQDYPWPHTYSAWPGPNSNTFPAWIAKQVPDLELELPFRAIGKDWVE